jgi:hypothetical protein
LGQLFLFRFRAQYAEQIVVLVEPNKAAPTGKSDLDDVNGHLWIPGYEIDNREFLICHWYWPEDSKILARGALIVVFTSNAYEDYQSRVAVGIRCGRNHRRDVSGCGWIVIL